MTTNEKEGIPPKGFEELVLGKSAQSWNAGEKRRFGEIARRTA